MTSAEPSAVRGAPTPGPGLGAPFVLAGRFHAAVFDMDGLLVDTEPLWVAAEAELFARHGQAFTALDVAATHGRSIEDTIDAYVGRLGTDDPIALRAELIALMRGHYEAGPPLRPGPRRLICWLRDGSGWVSHRTPTAS